MSTRRRARGWLTAFVLIAGLIVIAIAGYRVTIPVGLWLTNAPVVPENPGSPRVTRNAPCLALPAGLRRDSPTLAFIDDGALRRLSLASCQQTTLIPDGATGPVRISADGRYIGSGPALVTPRNGRQIQRPLGAHVFSDASAPTWAWAPHGDQLAGVTTDGGVVAGRPGHRPHNLEPAGFGASQILFDGPAAVIVVRNVRTLWRIPMHGGPAVQVYRDPSSQATLTLAAIISDQAIVWRQAFLSASVATDGDPLQRIDLADGHAQTIAPNVLLGYAFPCGSGLIVAKGEGREATAGKHIVAYSRTWQATPVGIGVSPSCSADGHVIAYANANFQHGGPFGNERRRIYIARLGHHPRILVPATRTGPGANDPLLAPNGRTVLWVQSEAERLNAPAGPTAQGALRAAFTTGAAHRTGPIANLGQATDFYGTWSWAHTVSASP